MPILERINTYSKFCLNSRKFLKDTFSLEDCEEIVIDRMQRREENFLNLFEYIFRHENNVYRRLLVNANYSINRIRQMVHDTGVDETLPELVRDGIYITVDEFKGRKPIIRNGLSIRADRGDFDNPGVQKCFNLESGATRSSGTRTKYDPDLITYMAPYHALIFNAHGISEMPIGLYFPIPPAASGFFHLLAHSKTGNPPKKWFTHVDIKSIDSSIANKFAVEFVYKMAGIYGVELPKPEFVYLQNMLKIAQWISETLKEYSGCILHTYASSALRVCRAAKQNGIDITGATFITAGEPLTPAKYSEIKSVGGIAIPRFGFVEGGINVGSGCARPSACDDIHLHKDSFALIQYERKLYFTEKPVDAFLFTSLSPFAPKLLLNVETDDFGILEKKNCNCKLGRLGFDEHFYNIKSFGKLTGERVTFVHTEIVKTLEEVIPEKFGGSLVDYQILEEEDKNGFTKLYLLVSPRVGKIDEEELKKTIYRQLGGTRAFHVNIWAQANTVQIRREDPIPTKRGKTFPFYIRQL